MQSNHFVLCHPLILLSSFFPSIRVFSNESVFRIRWMSQWVTTSRSLLKLISIELVMPSNHLILFRPLLLLALKSFPAQGSFPRSWLFPSGGQNSGASASATVLPMNIQGWFPLGFIGLISLQSKGLWRIFSNTTVQKHQFFSTQPSLQPNSKYVNLYKMYALVYEYLLSQA